MRAATTARFRCRAAIRDTSTAWDTGRTYRGAVTAGLSAATDRVTHRCECVCGAFLTCQATHTYRLCRTRAIIITRKRTPLLPPNTLCWSSDRGGRSHSFTCRLRPVLGSELSSHPFVSCHTKRRKTKKCPRPHLCDKLAFQFTLSLVDQALPPT